MAKSNSGPIWKLKRGADKKIRAGYPWVLGREIATTITNHKPGYPVELQDADGKFVARGYGNPKSQMAFRVISMDSLDHSPLSRPRMLEKILEAWATRKRLGFRGSFRMVFSEGDHLSGLIIDYYVGEQNGKMVQVFAVQVLTAGMDLALGVAETFFKDLTDQGLAAELTKIPWESTAVVLRNDVRSRKHEDLDVELPRFIKSVREMDFTKFPIQVNAATGDGMVAMDCDLFQGQKTGFFLDQTQNIRTVAKILAVSDQFKPGQTVRILDLCCYVGHWSTQLTRTLKARGCEVEATLVDVSARALEFAKQNVEREGGRALVVAQDVFKAAAAMTTKFDIVIADPPAFIKSKKDIPLGKHAYLKMNTQAFRLAKAFGYVASCTCSGLLTELEFKEVVGKALRRHGYEVPILAQGGPAGDHPGNLSFPEGVYLKMFVHQMPADAGASVALTGAVVGAAEDPDVL